MTKSLDVGTLRALLADLPERHPVVLDLGVHNFFEVLALHDDGAGVRVVLNLQDEEARDLHDAVGLLFNK